ncbi:MAG: protease Lon-related BREX system protein BrxL [Candidatus Methanosuratincola sp.]
MEKPNAERLNRVLSSLHNGLVSFLSRKLKVKGGEWERIVVSSLTPEQKGILEEKIRRGAPQSLSLLDFAMAIRVVNSNWKTLGDSLGKDSKNWFYEASSIRNLLAHQEQTDIPMTDTLRHIDTLKRIAERIGDEKTRSLAAEYYNQLLAEQAQSVSSPSGSAEGEGKGKSPATVSGPVVVTTSTAEDEEEEVVLDALDEKLMAAFPGRVVRKDLVKKLKVGFNVPVYVLEYLLGKYCSSMDRDEIKQGLERVKNAIAERIVQGDQTELVKARLQKFGSLKLIDLVTATFDEKVQGGKFWSKLATCGLDKVHISHEIVYKHERLLTGGVWANVELIYDDSLGVEGAIRPFVIQRLSPIQIASADFDEFVEGRRQFTRDEWLDVLIRSMGYEPTNPDISHRVKMLFLLRFVPMVEKNYNLIELGPRATGKSFIYGQISPYVILLSGGQGSVPDLFGWKHRKDKPGLVLKYDAVAFDEVAGPNFKSEGDKQMYKGYMESGAFARGDDKGILNADAGIVFNGNLDGDVETIARISHLFTALPDTIRNDMAFHDRWHAYLPGWEIPKMQMDYFTRHLGFISDYIAEIFHSELRKRNYTDLYDNYYSLGSHVEERDRKAIVKTVSGLIKLLHPDGECSKEEMREYLTLAMECRRRVKEQLKRMGGIEFSKVNLSFIDKESRQEIFVSCPEIGAIQMIPDGILAPGDLFTVGFDNADKRYSLYRIQISATPGGHKMNVVGTAGKNIRESAKMAFDYLKANARKMGIDRDIDSYNLNIQVMSLMQGKDTEDLGVAFFIALISALLGKPVSAGLVVLGRMSIHGVLSRVEGLGDKLRIAMDAGAKKVMIPTENHKDFALLPTEIIDKLSIDFYSDPIQAAFKALAE